MTALVTSLNASSVDQQLSTTTNMMDNLSAACQGIVSTTLAPSSSHWYPTLDTQLQALQTLAQEWLSQYASQMRSSVLTCVVHCGQAFQGARDQIDQLFAQAQQDPAGAKAGLQTQFTALQAPVQMVSTTVSTYEAALKNWGQRLQQAHDQMKQTVKQVQDEQASLKAQIDGLNQQIATLQAEVIKDRKAIAEAKAERDKGIVETVFGVLFAPFTGGLSLILAGIGVSSIVEAESKVKAMQATIEQYQMRIIAAQQNLTQDQTQVATLQALLFPAGIALSDAESGAQFLDSVRTSWEAFFQELSGVIDKISKATTAQAIIVEQAWFNAAVGEWDLIVTGTQGIIGAPISSQSVTCDKCQVPVIRVVPTGSHPAFPSDLKETVLADPNRLDPAANAQVLTWGDYTYWVASYVDNRVAFCFLAFDPSGKVVKRVEKSGARYLWQLTLDAGSKAVTATGQSRDSVTASLAELAIS